MKTQTLTYIKQQEQNTIEMVDLYNEATEDYEFWSKDFNMHFGYYKWFKTNPFKRDAMLNEMNRQVLNRLHISDRKHRLIDLGCGMGSTLRYALNTFKNLSAYGVTLSDFQIKHRNTLLKDKKGIIIKEDYNHTSFQPNTFNSALAIESFCHSGHSIKSLKEAHRILKPKGRLVIADAFLKKDTKHLNMSERYAYKQLCGHWSLEKLATINDIKTDLETIGFTDVKIENISWRVAPSVLHVPFAILGFILKKLFQLKPIKRESWHNLKGSFYALASGLHINSFGYYMISAVKTNNLQN